jgi:hypothetical protein
VSSLDDSLRRILTVEGVQAAALIDVATGMIVRSAGGYAIGPELVVRGLVGAGELEAVLRVAVADAMFVLSGGLVEACGVEPGAVDSQFALEPPAEVGWLLAEASRRMRVLASSRGLVEHDRDRMAAAPGAVQPGVLLGQGQDEILALANGRRTASPGPPSTGSRRCWPAPAPCRPARARREPGGPWVPGPAATVSPSPGGAARRPGSQGASGRRDGLFRVLPAGGQTPAARPPADPGITGHFVTDVGPAPSTRPAVVR